MSSSPAVSVIIPCFNSATTLAAAVESVISQKISAEIILIDDGSTDQTPSVIRELLARFNNQVIAISQTNQGQAAARNRGIRLASGEYLCFLDADDQYEPGFFAQARQVLDRQMSVIAVECKLSLSGTDRKPEPWQIEAMEATMPGTLMVRSSIVRVMGGFPDDPAFRGKVGGEDGCFRLQLNSFGDTYKLNFVGLSYRLRRGSHADLFLDRARLQDGRVVFDQQSAEELDGSFAAAIQRYRDAIGGRLIDKAVEQIQMEVADVASLSRLTNQSMTPFLSDSAVLGFCLFTLIKNWPMAGDVLEASTSSNFGSTHWLAAGCAASRNGKVVPSTPVPGQLFRAVCASADSPPFSDVIRLAETHLPRGGILILHSGQGPLPAELGLPSHWKQRLRLPQFCAFQKI
jgi:glycosyltransferase involved in cell wall biosynthesis